MPILNADEAKQVVFLKRSMRPGFAGIENELLFDPSTTLLFGDAKDTLGKLLTPSRRSDCQLGGLEEVRWPMPAKLTLGRRRFTASGRSHRPADGLPEAG